ncbi:hypothetical protein EGW08_015743, partial [Elysia chlorotica]
ASSGGTSGDPDIDKNTRLLTLSFIFVLILYPFPPVYAQNNTNSDVNKVLTAIQMLVKHYQDEYRNLNLDGFFGLRVLEGQLELLISEHSLGQHRHLTNATLGQMNALKEMLTNLAAIGLKAVKDDDAQYFKAFNPIVSQPWKVTKPHRKLDPSLRWEIPQYKAKISVMKRNFTEQASDRCMTELLSSGSHDCKVTAPCLKLMTSRGFTGYPITHQLLWSMLVEGRPKCLESVEQPLQQLGLKSIDHLQLELCTNNFYEMVAVAEVLMHGNVHESHQDLFLEQQFICPSIGFYEFLKKDYLDQILSWQFSSGCFGEVDKGSEEKEQQKIDFASLLEEYNGDQLKFAPEMIVKKAGIQKIFDGKRMSVQTADKLQKKVTLDVLKTGNMKQVNDKSAQLNSEVYKHRVSFPEASDLHKDENIKKPNLWLSKLDNAPAASHPEIPSKTINLIGERNRNKLLNHATRAHSPRIGRHLLVEKEMSGGCLSHKTGVAAGALVMYLRYLVDPGNIKWEGQHDLLLSDTRNLLQSRDDSALDSPLDSPLYEDESEKNKFGPDLEGDEGDGSEEGGPDNHKSELAPPANVQKENEGDEAAGKIDMYQDSVEHRDSNMNDAQNKSAENANNEDVDEDEDEDEDDDDLQELPDDELPLADDTREIVKFDSNGNPLAPEGRLIRDNEEDEDNENIALMVNKPEFKQYYHQGDYSHNDADKLVPLQDLQHQGLKTERADPREGFEQEEEGHFYDDDIEAAREDGVKRGKIGAYSTVALEKNFYFGGKDPAFPDQPNYTVLIVISVAPFFLLFFFLFKFVRKRRVHIRYHF